MCVLGVYCAHLSHKCGATRQDINPCIKVVVGFNTALRRPQNWRKSSKINTFYASSCKKACTVSAFVTSSCMQYNGSTEGRLGVIDKQFFFCLRPGYGIRFVHSVPPTTSPCHSAQAFNIVKQYARRSWQRHPQQQCSLSTEKLLPNCTQACTVSAGKIFMPNCWTKHFRKFCELREI